MSRVTRLQRSPPVPPALLALQKLPARATLLEQSAVTTPPEIWQSQVMTEEHTEPQRATLVLCYFQTSKPLLGEFSCLETRTPQAGMLPSAVSFLPPGCSTHKTLCKWNFGCINHGLSAPGWRQTGLLHPDRNVELPSQIQTTGENSSI